MIASKMILNARVTLLVHQVLKKKNKSKNMNLVSTRSTTTSFPNLARYSAATFETCTTASGSSALT